MRSFFFAILVIGMVSFSIPAFAETYYAKVENGIVTNVIVADSTFIKTQPGKWIQTWKDDPIKQYTGIGNYYNDTAKKMIVLSNGYDLVISLKSNYTAFLFKLSSAINDYYHPKTVYANTNMTEMP